MKALLSVSFGTSYAETRELTLDKIDAALADAFPDRTFRSAWTSGRIIGKVRAERGEEHDTLEGAFARLVADGVDDLVVSMTCLMEGHESRKISEAARAWAKGGARRLALAKPLLATQEDRRSVAEVIAGGFSGIDRRDAVLLMGHGSGYASNRVYREVQDELHALGHPGFFVATVEGDLAFEGVLPALGAFGARRVWLSPLMVVAGDHARNDLAGEGGGSWASRLASLGYEVKPFLRGLGEYGAIRRLVVDHALAASGVFGEG